MKQYLLGILIGLMQYPLLGKGQTQAVQKIRLASIKVAFEEMKPTDTLLLMYFENDLFNEPSQNGQYVELQSILTGGVYNFDIPIHEHTGYFFIAKKTQGRLKFEQLTNQLKAGAGDDVLLRINKSKNKGFAISAKYDFACYGKGEEKYNLRFKSDSLLYWAKSVNTPTFSSLLKYNQGNNSKNRINVILDYLEANRDKLTNHDFQLLKADFVFANGYPFFTLIKDKFKSLSGSNIDTFRTEYLRTVGLINLHGFSPEILVSSKMAASYFLEQAKATILISGKFDDPNALYDYLCSNFSGKVLDKLLVYYFTKINLPLDVKSLQLRDATKKIKSDIYLQKIKELETNLRMSNLDRSFDLKDKNNISISLDDFRGKIVLVDFWFTGCVFCTKFVGEQLVKVEEEFKDNPDVVFISLSVDRNKSTWLKSVEQKAYSLPSSLNLHTGGLGTDHPLIKMLNLQGFPSLLIIDKNTNPIVFGIANEGSPNLYLADKIISQIKSHL